MCCRREGKCETHPKRTFLTEKAKYVKKEDVVSSISRKPSDVNSSSLISDGIFCFQFIIILFIIIGRVASVLGPLSKLVPIICAGSEALLELMSEMCGVLDDVLVQKVQGGAHEEEAWANFRPR